MWDFTFTHEKYSISRGDIVGTLDSSQRDFYGLLVLQENLQQQCQVSGVALFTLFCVCILVQYVCDVRTCIFAYECAWVHNVV